MSVETSAGASSKQTAAWDPVSDDSCPRTLVLGGRESGRCARDAADTTRHAGTAPAAIDASMTVRLMLLLLHVVVVGILLVV